MTQSPRKRISDYQNQRLFENIDMEYDNLGNLIGKEILIYDYLTGTRYGEDVEEFQFAEFLFSDPEDIEPVYACWTASKVVVDQLQQVPKDELPVAAEVGQAGKGNRKYYTLK